MPGSLGLRKRSAAEVFPCGSLPQRQLPSAMPMGSEQVGAGELARRPLHGAREHCREQVRGAVVVRLDASWLAREWPGQNRGNPVVATVERGRTSRVVV